MSILRLHDCVQGATGSLTRIMKQLIYDMYEALQGLNRGLAYSGGRTVRGSASPPPAGDKKRAGAGGKPRVSKVGAEGESQAPACPEDNYPENSFRD